MKHVVYFDFDRSTGWLSRRLAPLGFVEGRNLRLEQVIADPDPAKRAAAARELVKRRPDAIVASTVAMLAPLKDDVRRYEGALLAAAESAGIRCEIAVPKSASDVERAMAPYKTTATDAAYVTGSGPIWDKAIELSLRQRIATFGGQAEEQVEAGMLMGYWLEFSDHVGTSVLAQVLRGGNPAEIPFEVPDRTRFILNRRTPQAIGVEFPPEILVRATRVVG